MSYPYVDLSCNRLERLLNKRSKEDQQAIMRWAEDMLYDSGQVNQLRNDNPMVFCLDLKDSLDHLPLEMFPPGLSPRSIRSAESAENLVERIAYAPK